MSPVQHELPATTALPNPFRDPIGVVQRYGYWMLGALLLGMLAGLLLWSRSAPSYFAEATVVVSRTPYSDRIVEPDLAVSDFSMTEALAAEVLSRSNITKLVSDFGLYPDLKGVETTGEIAERVRSLITIRLLQTLDEATGDGSERAYSIGFEAATPEAAAGVANRLAALFADTSSADRLQQQQQTTEFLRAEVSKTEAGLQQQTERIAEFRKRHAGTLPDELQMNLERMKSLDERRATLAFSIAQAGTAASLGGIDSSPEVRLARMREELDRLRVRKTDRHPDVLTLERQIADLEQRLRPGKRGARAPRRPIPLSERTVHMLREQLSATEAELAKLDEQVRAMPAVQEELKVLEERAAILRENHLDVLRKVQNAELGGKLLDSQQHHRVSVLNLAEPPSRPLRTPRRHLALAFAVAIAGALALGFGLELLFPVVLTSDDVTDVTGLPVLGQVTRIR